MNPQDLKILLEAVLLAAGHPITNAQLLELFDERERPSEELLAEALAALSADYETRGIELREVATGWRIQIRTRCVDIVSRLWQERASRYSRALLETLALIAYRQPITRSEIEEIRGVAVSSTIMRTLQERDWIRIVGHREVPGRPELIGTTKEFLDYFGLQRLDQLPTLAELRDVENVGVQLELPAGDVAVTAEVLAESVSVEGAVMTAVTESEVVAADDETTAVEAEAESESETGDENPNATTLVADADETKPAMYAPPAE